MALASPDEKIAVHEELDTKLLGLSTHFTSSVIPDLEKVIDPTDLQHTHKAIVGTVLSSVKDYRSAASVLAARSYKEQRGLFVTTPYSPWVAPMAPAEQIATSVGAATGPMYDLQRDLTSDAPADAPDAPPEPDQATVDAAISDLMSRVGASMDRIILNGARQTVLGNVARDHAARGWARITSGGACSFCLMLASRGLVYRSKNTAKFQAHDTCRCSAQASFKGEDFKPSPVAVAAQRLWSETSGGSPKDVQTNFRKQLKNARENGTWDDYLSDAYNGAYFPS